MKTLFGTQLTRRDVFRAAWRIRREDRIEMSPALRRAWAWARRKGAAFANQFTRATVAVAPRAHGVDAFNPRLAVARRRFQGRGCGSLAMGR